MTHQKVVSVLLAILFFSFPFSWFSWAEELTLTTYYPAPFGAYDRIRLVPRDSLPAEECCHQARDLGVMYYDNGLADRDEGVYICQKISTSEFNWVLAGRSVQNGQGMIENQKVVCMKSDGQFGVCINNPSFDGTCGCQ